MPIPLEPTAITDALADLPGWTYDADALHRRFALGSFRAAVGFLVEIAFEAERLDHHPELRNVYSTVEVRLTTHDAGDRVTALDVALARAIDAVARRRGEIP